MDQEANSKHTLLTASETPLAFESTSVHNTLNVLILDGGGVKGLSSLIILRHLLRQVEELVGDHADRAVKEGPLLPHEVFDLVVGSSTGGLIALMVGKLGMSVDDCIQQYRELSRKLFGEGRHRRGTTFFGLIRPRYCSHLMRELIEKLFHKRHHDASLQMSSPGYTNCAVVCRRYDNRYDSRYRDPPLVDIPSVICSHECLEYLACTIYDAARATSAAPTYFSQQRIGDHDFIDGGVGYNNPSWAAYDHYNNAKKFHHPGMTWQGARMINLGTGTCSPDHQAPTTKRLFGFIRMPKVLNLLKETATNSEAEAAKMRAFAPNANFDYQRFSADTGVCWIKMDEYDRLKDIEELTEKYVARKEIQEMLKQCAEGIAKDYERKNGG